MIEGDDAVRRTAAEMIEELESSRLIVMKWRSGDGWVRGAISHNPEWYQRLCQQFQRSRKRYPKSRTFIKRFAVLRALNRIATGKVPTGSYGDRLMPFIREETERRQDFHTHTHTQIQQPLPSGDEWF